MTVVLLTSCVITPIDIAFAGDSDMSPLANPTNLFIDLMFLIDIFVSFNAAYYDEEMALIVDRKKISHNYLTGWFAIDVLAIMPFDVILNVSNFNQLARVMRIGRLYKLVKLSRVLRMVKVYKNKSKMYKILTDFFNISDNFERLFIFLLGVMFALHLSACFWITTAALLGELD